ncbi:hypothetical protein AGLY_016443, partial [Aphis glycines]
MTLATTANYLDNGQRLAKLASDPTTSEIDKDDNATLGLRGGNNDDESMIYMDIDAENQSDSTNNPKRFKPGSPNGNNISAHAIENALNNVDTTLGNIRTYMADMVAATKIGKKWASGMVDFRMEVLVHTKKIAIEAVEIIGINKHRNYHPTYITQARTYSNVAEGLKDDGPEGPDPPPRTSDNKLSDYPPIGKPKSKSAKNSGTAYKNRINKAKKLPVKPTLRVKGTNDMDSLWKSIKLVLANPRVDSAKKLPSGDILVISTDSETVKAIKNISGEDSLEVLEEGNKKPKVKIKNIPSEYSAEFITNSIIEQNQHLKIESMSDVKPVFKCGPRNRDVVDWVLEVSPTIYNAVLNKRTFIGRCLALDHITKNCTNDLTCHHCAESGHESSTCQHKNENPVCSHCGDRNRTISIAVSDQLYHYCVKENVDVALVQEPYTRRGTLTGLDSGTIRTAKSNINEHHGIWAAIVVFNSSLDVLLKPHLTTIHTVTIGVSFPGQPLIDLVSSYFQYRKPTTSFVREITAFHPLMANRTIMCIDVNAFSHMWHNHRRNYKGQIVENMIRELNLIILNQPGNEHTFQGPRGRSNVDVTLASPSITNSIRDWRVLKGITASDHLMISFSVTEHIPELAQSPRTVYMDRKIDKIAFEEAVRHSLESLACDGTINGSAEHITNSLTSACERTLPKSDGNRKRRPPWWNAEVANSRRLLKQAHRAMLRLRSIESKQAFKKARNSHVNTIRKAKNSIWHKLAEEPVVSVNHWGKITKWLIKGKKEQSIPSVLRMQDGSYT